MPNDEELKVWGLHMGEHVGSKPIDEGYVAIGWQELGDLREYADREAYKAAIAEKIPGATRRNDAKALSTGRVACSTENRPTKARARDQMPAAPPGRTSGRSSTCLVALGGLPLNACGLTLKSSACMTGTTVALIVRRLLYVSAYSCTSTDLTPR